MTMKLPASENVDPQELIESLRMSADIMVRIDGDRDHMNTSRLTCGQVQGAFRLMLIAANKLEETTAMRGAGVAKQRDAS